MNETFVTVTGNMTADPVQRQTRAGEPFATLRIAQTERYRTSAGQYENGSTSYYNVVAYGTAGRNVLATLRRGMPVVVHGRQRVTEWTTPERRGTAVDVQAYAIGPDLSRCWAEVHKGGAPLRGNDRLDESEIQAALAELDDRPVEDAAAGPDGLGGGGVPAESDGPGHAPDVLADDADPADELAGSRA